MEARGVSGATSLIQTSRPNARDIKSLKSPVRLPAASSLNADIYELLPNDTDVTQFLRLGIDAANLAFAHGVYLYHTPGDNLANLDKRSLFHIGASALAAVEALAAHASSGDEPQMLYAELLGKLTLAISEPIGFVLMLVGLFSALAIAVQARGAGAIRTWLAPLFAMILGVAFAYGAMLSLGAMRVEPSFGAAQPWAVRAVQYAAAFLGAGLSFALAPQSAGSERSLAAAWFWFAVFGLLGGLVVSGAMILFAPPLAIFSIGAFAWLAGARLLLKPLTGIAAVLFFLIVYRLVAHGENGLLVENAAPFVLAPLFMYAFLIPLFADDDTQSRWGLPAAAAAMLVVAISIAMLVPAYSPLAPRPLSIVHATHNKSDESYWGLPGNAPPPDAMADIAPFSKGTIRGLPGTRYLATAPNVSMAELSVERSIEDGNGDRRRIKYEIEAPDADTLWLPISEPSAVHSIAINGKRRTVNPISGGFQFSCHGRACRSISLSLDLERKAETPKLNLIAIKHGLGEESAALALARPLNATPVHWGDVRAVITPLPTD